MVVKPTQNSFYRFPGINSNAGRVTQVVIIRLFCTSGAKCYLISLYPEKVGVFGRALCADGAPMLFILLGP